MHALLAIGGLPGGMEWILIVLVILIFFGAKKNPRISQRFR